MIVLGIDPGLATMGYGIVEYDGRTLKCIQYGTLVTRAGQPMPQRLRSIFLGVNTLIETYKPDDIAFEELFFARNVTTAMDVGAARGAAIVAAAQRSENIFEYTPMQVKQAVVGYGRADKQQVQTMVKILLGLESEPKPDDAADALGVAICHAHCYKQRSLFKIK